MEVEKRSSKGGFLQLFDWNVKSRKKLFSNKPELPESSKQGKENIDKLDIMRLQQTKWHDSNHGPSFTGSDWASTADNDEGCGTKAPGVVARLMGLDSMPTLDASDPSFTPFIDSHSFRHSLHPRITAEYENEHFADYGMRNKLDGLSRNPVEDRLQKLQNRPIERFQSEVLPPRSAKSVPITHHRMLSPIKSPGFVLSRNVSCIMEAASKMIEQSPQSTVNCRLPSFGSSSVPLRIRDLKEKMEAAQRMSRFPEASQRSIMRSPVNSSKALSRDKRQCQSEVVNLKQGVAGSSQPHKNKLNSLATPTKTHVQKEGTTSRNRSTMKQKEDGTKSIHLDKKQRNTPKRLQNGSTTGRTSEVLTQNNQKQNCASNKDRPSLKPRVPYQHDSTTTFTKVSSREVKASKMVSENSTARAKKAKFVSSETGKEPLSSKTKNISGKKRPTVLDVVSDGTSGNNLVIKEKERSVKCNVTIDGSSNWEPVDRKNGMDVVSFTFTSPIKKPVPESETCGQSPVKSRGMRLKFQEDQPDIGTSGFPSFVTPVVDSDALSVLLEQKLKELSSLVETSQCDIIKEGSSPTSASETLGCVQISDVAGSPSAKYDNMFHPNLQKDKSVIQLEKARLEWQGVEVTECNSDSEINGSGIKDDYQPSLSDVSSITSNSTTTLTSYGNKHHTSATNTESFTDEIELQDSATSLSNPVFEFKSITKCSSQSELEHIKQIISHTDLSLDNFTFTPQNIKLFNHLKNQNKPTDALFDCVNTCLGTRHERAFNGSYKDWSKWSTMFQNKDLLADDIYKEIQSWTRMEELMVDEVVDKDMSCGEGKWLEFRSEAFEEGVVIEEGIVSVLIDEIVADLNYHCM